VVSLSTLLGAVICVLVWALRFVLTLHLKELRSINQSIQQVNESMTSIGAAAQANVQAVLAAIDKRQPPNRDETINRCPNVD